MYVKKDPSLANRDGGNGGSGSGSGGVSVANLQRLKAILLRFGAHIRDTVRPQGGSLAGEYIFELLASGAGITYANNAVFLSFVSGVGELLMEARRFWTTPPFNAILHNSITWEKNQYSSRYNSR